MRQAVTRRWWEQERHKYDLFVSEAVENECRRGDPIAVATVYRIDYLATWNIRHIADAQIRRITEGILEDNGYRRPIVCTPEELFGVDALDR